MFFSGTQDIANMFEQAKTPKESVKEDKEIKLDGDLNVAEWNTRWEEGQIGFHNTDYHKYVPAPIFF